MVIFAILCGLFFIIHLVFGLIDISKGLSLSFGEWFSIFFWGICAMVPIIISVDEKNKTQKKNEFIKKAEEIKKKEEDVERERRKKEAYEREMINLVEYSNDAISRIKSLYAHICNTIPDAEKALDKAEEEFNGGFYAPFWDQIEISTNQLALYNHYLKGINHFMEVFWESVKKIDEEYKGKLELCVLPGKLPDPREVSNRLAKIVRIAQRNFEFSIIYEQRKTNKLLYEGFRNLGDAIYSIGDRITNSLNELSCSLDSSLNDIISSTNENSRIISDNIQAQTRRLDGHAEEQRRYESDSLRTQSDQQKTLEQQKRVLERQNRRIDNIQRGRKPGLLDE